MEYDLHMNGHKYSQLLNYKHKAYEFKTKLFQRKLYAKLVRKSVRICTTRHRRGHLLDKLSEWLESNKKLEERRRRRMKRKQILEKRRALAERRKQKKEQREPKDIRTKSKSSVALSNNGGLFVMPPDRSGFSPSSGLDSPMHSMLNSSSSRNSSASEAGSTPASGKVKLKIKVDPNKYRDMIQTSPATFSTSTPTGFKRNNSHQQFSFQSPLLQSALMASTVEKIKSSNTKLHSTSPTTPDKIFYCLYCPKQFSIRSSYLRHARTQHGIDTKSQQFLETLREQTTHSASIVQASGDYIEFPTHPLPPSEVISNSSQSQKSNVKRKSSMSKKSTKKRKAEEMFTEDSSTFSQNQIPPTGKKIKLSLKLGKAKNNSIGEASSLNQHRNSTEAYTAPENRWQQSSFQMLSPATSPSSKVLYLFLIHPGPTKQQFFKY